MFKSVKFVISEHKENIRKIDLLAKNEIRIYAAGTTLGYWWTLAKDLIYFFAYGCFMALMYSSSTIEDVPRLVFLVTGLIPWYFITDSLGGGSMAIRKRAGILTKIKFPITIVPTYDILSIFYKRLASFLIVFLILGLNHMLLGINIFYLLYYTFAMVIFMMAFNMFISCFVAISKDFTELYQSIVRIMIFFVPIMWSLETINNPLIKHILMLNPLIYLIRGMRYSFIGNVPNTLEYTIYFWIVTLIFFVVGSSIQLKLKRIYADYI